MTSLTNIKLLVQKHMARQQGQSPYRTQADGLILLRSQSEAHPTHMMHQPALCVVVQGAKWTAFGQQRLDYRAGQAMITSLETLGDLLPWAPSFLARVDDRHSSLAAARGAGGRSWSGLRSRSPAAAGGRPPWAEWGRTWF